MAGLKKKLLDVNDRVLLYLSTVPDISRVEFDAPFSITQTGIAKKIGISRRNVPRAVNLLINEHHVESKKAHISGLKQKRSIYFLTPRGYSKAAGINLQLSKVKITVIEADGTERICDLKDIPSMLPDNVNYNDIVRDTEYGILDFNKTQEKITLIDKKYLDCSNTLFRPRYVFGRAEQRKLIEKWYEDKSTRALVITGIAGIGKTTLIADQINEMKKHHIICIKIHQWTTLRYIVTALADFLSTMGQKEIMNYLKSQDSPEISELHILFEKSMKNLDLLMVFDDCHNANPDIKLFFKVLYEVFLSVRKGKMITIGRSVPSYYDRRAVAISGQVREIQLDGLDKESCRRLFLELELDLENLDDLYSSTNGHPLYIELSEGKTLNKSRNIKKHILDTYLSHLSTREKELLEYISVLRYPVEEPAIAPEHQALTSLLSKGVLHELPDGSYELHDIIKDYLYRLQGKERLMKNHSHAAEFYIEQEDELGVLEAISHRIKARQFDLATELTIEHGGSLIKNGYSTEIARNTGIVLSRAEEIDKENKLNLLVLISEALSIIGEWDQALEHYEYVVELGTELEHVPELARAHLGMGEIYQRRHDMDEADEHLQSALRFYTEAADKKGLAEVNYQLGVLHERAGEYDKALRMFGKCEKIGETIGDPLVLAKAYNASGRIYNLKGKYEKAMMVKEKALEFLVEIGDKRELAKVYTGLGTCAFNMRDIDEAIKNHTMASETAEEAGDLRIMAHALYNLASTYIEKPNLIIARENLEKAKEIFIKLKDKKALATVYLGYAVLFIKWDDNTKITEYFDKSIDLFNEIGSIPDLAMGKRKYGQYYRDIDNLGMAKKLFKEAIRYYKEIDADQAVKDVAAELEEMDSSFEMQ